MKNSTGKDQPTRRDYAALADAIIEILENGATPEMLRGNVGDILVSEGHAGVMWNRDYIAALLANQRPDSDLNRDRRTPPTIDDSVDRLLGLDEHEPDVVPVDADIPDLNLWRQSHPRPLARGD